MTLFRLLSSGLVGCAFVAVPLAAQETEPAAAAPAAVTAETAPAEPAAPEPPPLLPSDPQALATVLQKFSPANRRRFAEAMSVDWQDPPEWGLMMLSVMKGEPTGPGTGWYRGSDKRYDFAWLASQCDKNGDGLIVRDELPEAAPYGNILFSRLDRDADGKIRPIDFDYVTRQPSTPPLMMSQFLTQLLDGDTNGRITVTELQELLARADKDKTGFLTIEDLQRDFTRAFADMMNSPGEEMPTPDEFVRMFFNGELGMMESGPDLGESAPDFTLPTHDGARTVTLSESRGKPVVLVFGSFSCGPFRSQAGLVEKLYQRYKDQVDIYAVYIRDAHPTDGWRMSINDKAGIAYEQPKTLESRNLVASSCCLSLGLTVPLLVDTIDDRTNRAYSGFPDRLYLIDRQGKVAFKSGRGPFGYRPRELEQTLLLLLLDEHLHPAATTAQSK